MPEPALKSETGTISLARADYRQQPLEFSSVLDTVELSHGFNKA